MACPVGGISGGLRNAGFPMLTGQSSGSIDVVIRAAALFQRGPTTPASRAGGFETVASCSAFISTTGGSIGLSAACFSGAPARTDCLRLAAHRCSHLRSTSKGTVLMARPRLGPATCPGAARQLTTCAKAPIDLPQLPRKDGAGHKNKRPAAFPS